jgi:hypothetical protein
MVCLVIEQRCHYGVVIYVFKGSCHHIETIKFLRLLFCLF